MDDGLLDVLVVPVLSLLRIAKEIHRLFDGTTNQSASLIYRQCRSVTVRPLDSAPARHVEIDGEIEGVLPVTIAVTGRKIRVVGT